MKLLPPVSPGSVLAVALLVVAPCFAADRAPGYDLKEHYTKYEYRIPMRDGVKLFTSVLVPKDASTPYPFIMERTPYSVEPYGEDEYGASSAHSEMFLKEGYIWVRQDVRGRSLSEGTFLEMTPHRAEKKSRADVDESSDAYDTIEWLLKYVPNHNGRVGMWGVSYPGFYAAAGAIDSHPALKAVSPQAPVTDLYLNDDAYHGGAFMLAANFGFMSFFKPQVGPTTPPKVWVPFDYGTNDGYEFFLRLGPLANAATLLGGNHAYWDEVVGHPTYDDHWKARAIWRHFRNIRCAVLTVGGWFDAEDLMGPLRTYREIEANNPGIANSLVMGPWVHGGWEESDGRQLGSVDFAADTAKFYREKIILPFFEQHLKDKGEAKLPEAFVFETGTNVWRRYPAWPAPGAQPRMLYFREQGALGFDVPPPTAGSDRYVSDPAKPVPFVGYTALGVPQEYMVADQRFAATRPDVLVYVTEPLEESVTFAGPVSPRLFVATTGTDADWVVKLIDVYPPERSNPASAGAGERPKDVPPPGVTLAGYQQLVRGEPFRGKYRGSFERPEAFVPGQVTAVNFTMPDVNHTFRRGHRIMVQVQSSWFPLVDRNPQTFVNIPTARAEDFRAATQQLFRGGKQASGIEVYVLPQPTAEGAAVAPAVPGS
jgi:uncharacterized protein